MMKTQAFKQFAALLLLLAAALNANAQEAYATLTIGEYWTFDDYTHSRIYECTLTFYYDDQKSSRDSENMVFEIDADDDPAWISFMFNYSNNRIINDRYKITKAVFDPSFAGATPISTSKWFYHDLNWQYNSNIALFVDLTEIVGLEYLNTGNVTDMSEMFSNNENLTSLDLSELDFGKVTDANGMFSGCSGLYYLDVSTWDTGQLRNGWAMFYGCSALTSLDLSAWDTQNMTNTNNMFYDCTNLTTIWCGDNWNMDNVTNSYDMFYNCTSLVGGMGTAWSSSHTDKLYARADAPGSPGYLTYVERVPYAVLMGSALIFLFDYSKEEWQATEGAQVFDITDGTWPGWYSSRNNITHVFFTPSFAAVKPVTTAYWFSGMMNLESIENLRYLNTSEVTDMNHMFDYCYALQSLDLSHFDTSKVKDMSLMFDRCTSLEELDLGSFDTGNVENLCYMFSDCQQLTSLDLSHFNTEKVTKIDHMFTGCKALQSLDISSFNTSLVTSLNNMFSDCESLTTLDLSSFETGIVTNMHWMFRNCKALTSIALSSFNTSGVTDFSGMFLDCSSLKSIDVSSFDTGSATDFTNMFCDCSSLRTLDLTNFNTGKVTKFGYMFNGCSNLRTIYAGAGWSTARANWNNSEKVFTGCTNIRGGRGTVFNPSEDDYYYARIDGGPDAPGYLTDKSAIPTGIETTESIDEFQRFAPNGTRISTPRRGINIIKQNDGSVRKVMVK